MYADNSAQSQLRYICEAVKICAVLALIAALTLTFAPASADHKPGHSKGGGGGGGDDPPPPPPAADPAIAFTAGSNNVLVVMNEDGSNMTGLVSNALMAQWSPDLDGDPTNGYQGTIAFNRSSSTDGIWLVDVRTINGVPTPLRIRQVYADQAFAAKWSPDLDPDAAGYQGALAFGTPNGIELLAIEWDGNDNDPSTIHAAFSEVIVPTVEGLPYLPSWSPDGQRIAFIHIGPGLQFDLRIVDDLDDPENSQRVLVTAAQIGGETIDPAWSNTSNTIAFAGLWTVDADDPENTLINLGVGGRWPAWSPDDSAVLYHAFVSPGNTSKIRLLSLITGEATTLAGDKKVHYRLPHWRPF
jgi:hypothetical protein